MSYTFLNIVLRSNTFESAAGISKLQLWAHTKSFKSFKGSRRSFIFDVRSRWQASGTSAAVSSVTATTWATTSVDLKLSRAQLYATEQRQYWSSRSGCDCLPTARRFPANIRSFWFSKIVEKLIIVVSGFPELYDVSLFHLKWHRQPVPNPCQRLLEGLSAPGSAMPATWTPCIWKLLVWVHSKVGERQEEIIITWTLKLIVWPTSCGSFQSQDTLQERGSR